jgi:tetratricopeptide (TPR) repeat protein
MKHYKFFVALALFLGLLFSGYQCASTEITSAKLYIQQKNWDKAVDVLNKEVEKNPKSDEGYYLLGYVYGEQGKYSEMVKAFDNSLGVSNKFAKEITDTRKAHWVTNFNRGVNSFQQGNKTNDPDSITIFYNRAISEFNTASVIEPDSAETYKTLAVVYLSKGDNDSAIPPLEKIIKMEDALEGYRFLGEIYYVKGLNLKNQDKEDEAKLNFEKALDILKKGNELYPDDQEMSLALSNTLINLGRPQEAISLFKKAVEDNPNDKYNRYNYGVVLLSVEDYENAEAQFLEAIELDPEYSNAIFNLGVTYLRWGTYINKKAEEEGKMTSDFLSKYQAALPYLEKAVESEVSDANIWETLGRVYSVLGMQDDAAKAFSKADELRK